MCYRNLLTSLDFSNNPNIAEIRCGENQITSLELSHLSRLDKLDCGCDKTSSPGCEIFNPMTKLDISNNTSLRFLDLMYMPTLTEVCVWELPFPPEGVNVFFPDVDTTGSPNIYFTMDCTQ